MRKFFMITALVVMGALTACSSDDNNTPAVNAYEGTWIADRLSYEFNGVEREHNFDEMPGNDFAVYQNDKIELKANTFTLYEYKKVKGEETISLGTIQNNLLTFDNDTYASRTILSADETTLVLQYPISMMGATLPVKVTYIKQ